MVPEVLVSTSTKVADRVRMVEAWAVSGLTQREFGRLHEVSVSSLNRWAMAVRRGTPMFRRGEAAPDLQRPSNSAWRRSANAAPEITGGARVSRSVRWR